VKTYSIKAPDGKVISIQGPDNADPKEVTQRLMEGWRGQFPVTATGPEATRRAAREEVAAQSPSTAKRFITGVGNRMNEIGYSLKEPFADLTPEQRNKYETGKAVETEAGPAAAVGAGTLDASLAALPMTRLAMLKNAAPLVRIAGNTAIGSLQGGATNLEDRGKKALIGGITAGGTSLAGEANTALRAAGKMPTLSQTTAAIKKFLKSPTAISLGATDLMTSGIQGAPHLIANSPQVLGPAAGLFGVSELARRLPGIAPAATSSFAQEIMR
jgi:hypothetical protein